MVSAGAAGFCPTAGIDESSSRRSVVRITISPGQNRHPSVVSGSAKLAGAEVWPYMGSQIRNKTPRLATAAPRLRSGQGGAPALGDRHSSVPFAFPQTASDFHPPCRYPQTFRIEATSPMSQFVHLHLH